MCTLIVPPVDLGSDSVLLGVSRRLLKILAAIKGILLILAQDGVKQDDPPNDRVTGLLAKLVRATLEYVAAEKQAEEECRAEQGEETIEGEISESNQGETGHVADQNHKEEGAKEPHDLLKTLATIVDPQGVKTKVTNAKCTAVLRGMLDAARNTRVDYDSRDTKQRRREMRKAINDPSRGYNRFFKSLRADQLRPTSVLKIEGKLTANMGDIFDAFDAQWRGVYHRLAENPLCFQEFYDHYGEYMTAQPAGDLIPDGDQLAAAAARARPDAAAGRDAWRPSSECMARESQAAQSMRRKRSMAVCLQRGQLALPPEEGQTGPRCRASATDCSGPSPVVCVYAVILDRNGRLVPQPRRVARQ